MIILKKLDVKFPFGGLVDTSEVNHLITTENSAGQTGGFTESTKGLYIIFPFSLGILMLVLISESSIQYLHGFSLLITIHINNLSLSLATVYTLSICIIFPYLTVCNNAFNRITDHKFVRYISIYY
jgi:hypothetical protein